MKFRRLSTIAPCVALFVALFFLTVSSSSFELCEHDRKNHRAYDTLHKKDAPFGKAIGKLGLGVACTRQTIGENDGAITALSGIAVALFTLALWLSTEKLWKSAKEQAADMARSIRAAEIAADAMLKQAEAAEQQANISKLTLQITVRPIVGMHGFKYGRAAPGGIIHSWNFSPILRNVGPTRTIGGITFTSWIFTRTDILDSFEYPDIIRPNGVPLGPQKAPIGADKSITGVPAVVPIELLIEAYERRGHVLIWGWIEYDDGLPGTERHRTEFASEMVLRLHPMLPDESDGGPSMEARFRPRHLPDHNDADQDCFRQPSEPRPTWTAHSGPRQDLPPSARENIGA